MKTARRKVTLNLLPMLDLMLIVIFAQYLAMRDQSQHDEARASQAISEVEVARTALADQRREAELMTEKAPISATLWGNWLLSCSTCPTKQLPSCCGSVSVTTPPPVMRRSP